MFYLKESEGYVLREKILSCDCPNELKRKKNVITMTISVTFIMQRFVPYDDAFMLG